MKIPVNPEMKRNDPGACKGNVPYYTFISNQTKEAVKECLAQRLEALGPMEDTDPSLASTSTNVPLKPENTR